jgi:hypothetical protein
MAEVADIIAIECGADLGLDVGASVGLDAGLDAGSGTISEGLTDELGEEGGDSAESCETKGLKGLKAGTCDQTKAVYGFTDDFDDTNITEYWEDFNPDFLEEPDDLEPRDAFDEGKKPTSIQEFIDGANEELENAPKTFGKAFVNQFITGIAGLISGSILTTISYELAGKKNDASPRYFCQNTMYLTSSRGTKNFPQKMTYKTVQKVFFDINDPTYNSMLQAIITCRINCKKDLINQYLQNLLSLGQKKISFKVNNRYAFGNIVGYKYNPIYRVKIDSVSGQYGAFTPKSYKISSLLSDPDAGYNLIMDLRRKNLNMNYNSLLSNNLIPFNSVTMKYTVKLNDTDKDGKIIETSSSSGSATATVSTDGFNTNWTLGRGRARYLAMLAALQAQQNPLQLV